MASFCSSCQAVKEHPDIFCETAGQDKQDFHFSQELTPKSKAYATITQEAIDALTKINAYGGSGTKNPTQEEIDTLTAAAQGERFTPNFYNLILEVLRVDAEAARAETKTRIMGSYFESLESYINNYALGTDRCESTSCQSGQGCQTACQKSCQTNCESGICGCLNACLGTCEYAGQHGGSCGECDASCLICQGGCENDQDGCEVQCDAGCLTCQSCNAGCQASQGCRALVQNCELSGQSYIN